MGISNLDRFFLSNWEFVPDSYRDGLFCYNFLVPAMCFSKNGLQSSDRNECAEKKISTIFELAVWVYCIGFGGDFAKKLLVTFAGITD